MQVARSIRARDTPHPGKAEKEVEHMVKNSSVAFVVFLAALGLAGASCGKSDQEKSSSSPRSSSPSESASPAIPPSPPPGPSAGAPAPGVPGSMAAAPKETTGEVVSANPGAKTLVVKANGSEMTFDVKETAASDLGSMKPGDRVTVQYTENAGKYTAEMIRKG
jgi:hypothetical protein